MTSNGFPNCVYVGHSSSDCSHWPPQNRLHIYSISIAFFDEGVSECELLLADANKRISYGYKGHSKFCDGFEMSCH